MPCAAVAPCTEAAPGHRQRGRIERARAANGTRLESPGRGHPAGREPPGDGGAHDQIGRHGKRGRREIARLDRLRPQSRRVRTAPDARRAANGHVRPDRGRLRVHRTGVRYVPPRRVGRVCRARRGHLQRRLHPVEPGPAGLGAAMERALAVPNSPVGRDPERVRAKAPAERRLDRRPVRVHERAAAGRHRRETPLQRALAHGGGPRRRGRLQHPERHRHRGTPWCGGTPRHGETPRYGGTPRSPARRAIGDHAQRHGRMTSRPFGQVRRGNAQRAQPRHREQNAELRLERRLEGHGMVLRRAVRRQHPACEHAAGRPVERLHAFGRPHLVVGGERRAGESRKQQHAEQRACAVPVATAPVATARAPAPPRQRSQLHQAQADTPERGNAPEQGNSLVGAPPPPAHAGLALPPVLRPDHPNGLNRR